MKRSETVLINISHVQQGFLMSMAKLLSSSYRIVFVASDKLTKKYIQRMAPDIIGEIIVADDFRRGSVSAGVIGECLEKEKKYGEKFAALAGYDRGLGKGYIFNADLHPTQKKALWPLEKKYQEILNEINFHEGVLEKYKPRIIVSGGLNKRLFLVAAKNDIPCLYLGLAKYGRRCFWVENVHYQNSALIRRVRENLENFAHGEDSRLPEYMQEKISQQQFSGEKYSYAAMLKRLYNQVLLDTYRHLKGTYNKDGYCYLGWVRPILNRPYVYRYFLKHGKKPEDLRQNRIVYFPLHLEPETALLALSPEFNNSMEMAAWISKSLPADAVLVLKESPECYGVRSRKYYDFFRKMANVRLAHPAVSSWDWIKASSVTATITGTAAIESVYFKKPVLSFGKHQIVNHLPSVRLASNFETANQGMRELLELDPGDRVFNMAAKALSEAQLEVSFELPDYGNLFPGHEFQDENAKAALEKLHEQYGHVL